VGKFTNMIVNCQIYDRHIENAKIMLDRKSVPANPSLYINPNKTDFYDFTLDDFKILDYPKDLIKEVNPQLKFELGI
jgi:thymidylate synthase